MIHFIYSYKNNIFHYLTYLIKQFIYLWFEQLLGEILSIKSPGMWQHSGGNNCKLTGNIFQVIQDSWSTLSMITLLICTLQKQRLNIIYLYIRVGWCVRTMHFSGLWNQGPECLRQIPTNKPKMAYSRNAFTCEIARDIAKPDGLT